MKGHAIILACLPFLPVLSHANLTTLEITFSPDSESFFFGETVDVSARTDNIGDAEYRFVLEAYDADEWSGVADSGWQELNTFSVDTSNHDVPSGNFRLVTFARSAENPDEFVGNYQTFTFGNPELTDCNFIEGKHFTNISAAQVLPLTVSISQAIEALTPPFSISFAQLAPTFSAISFDEETANATMDQPINFTVSLAQTGGQMMAANGELSGNFNCEGNTLSIGVSGPAIISGGLISLIDTSEASFLVQGEAIIDAEEGTITAGETKFQLAGASAPSTTSASGSGSFSLGMTLLLILHLMQRMRRKFLYSSLVNRS